MITIQKYVRPASLEEAYQRNQKNNNLILGGMLWTKMMTRSIDTAIDLSGLGLDTIEETEAEFSIGAMGTLRRLEQHEGLNAYTCNAVKHAVQDIVGVQFRNLATVGGSLWGRFGFSDVLTAFLAMDAYVQLYKGGTVPIAQFARMKQDRDILVRVIVKKTPAVFAYSAVRGQSTDFPMLACAAAKIGGEYRLCVGARPAKAMLLTDETHILDDGLTEESVQQFADWACDRIPTGSNTRGSAAYRTRLLRTLTARLLHTIKEAQ